MGENTYKAMMSGKITSEEFNRAILGCLINAISLYEINEMEELSSSQIEELSFYFEQSFEELTIQEAKDEYEKYCKPKD